MPASEPASHQASEEASQPSFIGLMLFACGPRPGCTRDRLVPLRGISMYVAAHMFVRMVVHDLHKFASSEMRVAKFKLI